MELRPLGATGFSVSEIGFGTFKLGRNQNTKYAADYELPSDDEVDQLLTGALDLGITLFDTAPAYGVSEAQLGRFLAASGQREAVVVSTKVGERFENGKSHYAFDRKAVEASLTNSRRLLRTDQLDIVCVHSDGRDLDILNNTDVLDVLCEQRDSGSIRAVGFSGKTIEGHRACFTDQRGIDLLMVEFNSAQREQAAVIDEAHRLQRGVLVKKGLASGQLPAAESIRFVLEHQGVSSLVLGGLSLEHLRENVAAC